MTGNARQLGITVVLLQALNLAALGDENARAAVETEQRPAVAESPADVERLRTLVSDLDSPDFDVRREATARLIEAGADAVPHVADAAETDDLERATRSLDILKRLYQSDDPQTKAAAQKALETLAKSERRSVAQRAAAATAKPEPVPQFGGVVGNIQIQVQGIQVARAAGGMRMQVRNVNGKREIKVEQNGQKVAITDTNGKDITVKVVETADGKEKTSEYRGDDLDDLRKKHPEGAKIYEKYGANRNGIGVIRGVGAGIQIQAAPVPVPVLPVQPALPNPARKPEGVGGKPNVDEHLRESIKRLESLAEQNPAQADELRRVARELEKTRLRLQGSEE